MIRRFICAGKTDVLTEVVLVSKAKELVEKYKKEPENQIFGRVLPQQSNQKYNADLEILSNLLEGLFELKTHIARHTYRQLLGEAGITDMCVIKRMMGQTRKGDIDRCITASQKQAFLHQMSKFLVWSSFFSR